MVSDLRQRQRAAHFANALRKAGDLKQGFGDSDVAAAITRRLESPMTAVPLLRPGYVEPTWLAPIASFWQRALLSYMGMGPPVFATFSGPTQTGKSDMGEVGSAWLITKGEEYAAKHKIRGPSVATLSYGAALTLPRSRRIRDDVQLLGVELRDDSSAVGQWTTKSGGGLLATGVGGPVTGQPGLTVLNLEDPYQDEQEARSAAVRERLESFFTGVMLTRLGPRTSVMVSFSRWATNDLIGYIRDRKLPGWEHYTVPAIDDDGEPVARIPGKDRAFYKKQRDSMAAKPGTWEALMMGEPRPREGFLFKGSPPTYAVRPERFDCIRIGLDFAYSNDSRADHNAAVVVGKLRDKYYLLRVIRKQCNSVAWAAEVKALKAAFPAASMHAYVSGTERGPIDMLAVAPYHLRIEVKSASADKYSRAQSTAAHWNGNEAEIAEANAKIARGIPTPVPALVPRRVYLPEQAEWDLPGFIERTLDFTGADGGVDDEQDAMVAAVDACGPPVMDAAGDSSMRVGSDDRTGYF